MIKNVLNLIKLVIFYVTIIIIFLVLKMKEIGRI